LKYGCRLPKQIGVELNVLARLQADSKALPNCSIDAAGREDRVTIPAGDASMTFLRVTVLAYGKRELHAGDIEPMLHSIASVCANWEVGRQYRSLSR
jgi:hypothetical protein